VAVRVELAEGVGHNQIGGGRKHRPHLADYPQRQIGFSTPTTDGQAASSAARPIDGPWVFAPTCCDDTGAAVVHTKATFTIPNRPPNMRRGIRSPRQSSVDAHVGSRIRLRRMNLSMSQGQLGEAIGLTFQQVQKYEHGVNRVSASKLYSLSQTLGVSVSFFFENMPATLAQKEVSTSAICSDLLAAQETLELVRAYYTIPGTLRHALCQVVKVAARKVPTTAAPPRRPRSA
jgi:transcriptional regulator with XRE-family HTH domain